MSFYSEMRELASGILKEFNQGSIKLIQLVEPENGTPDNPGEMIETSYDACGAVKGVSYKYLKESFVTSTDLEVTIGVIENVTPSINDFIEIDGVRHKIIEDISVPAAGTRVVWKFIVRRGG